MYPDRHQTLIDCSLSPAWSLKKSSNSVHNFLRYFAHRHTPHIQTDRRPLLKHNLLGGGNKHEYYERVNGNETQFCRNRFIQRRKLELLWITTDKDND